MKKQPDTCRHCYERRENDYGFYWLCTLCRKHKPIAKDPLTAAYMARDGVSEAEASEIANAVRGVLS